MQTDQLPDRPVVAARAPGRINLIGEHLDYNGGRCLPIALPMGTTATLSPLPGRQVRVTSAERFWSGTVDQRPAGWASYVTGVLAALEVSGGVEIVIESNVPIGAGLSSSAALEGSVALAANEFFGLGLDRSALVDACVRAENDYVGVPTGGMDQSVAFFGTAGAAVLLDFSSGSRTLIPFDPAAAGLELVIVDTGVSHQLADSEYGQRRAECDRAAAELGLRHLAEVSFDALPRLSTESLRRRARHVVTEQQRVLEFTQAIHLGAWDEAGALMTASHLSLREDFTVSCPELDLTVATALAAGALGSRMTGGGFGGSAIVLGTPETTALIAGRLATSFAENGWDAPTLYRVEASRGAAVLT